MGREIRRVPIGWEHPKKVQYNRIKRDNEKVYQPLYDKDFEEAMSNWLLELDKWLSGEFKRVVKEYPDNEWKIDEPYRMFVEWYGNAPDSEYYRPIWPSDAVMGYALYEDVSEGTPISPTFETTEELVKYLVENGDYWGYKWDKEAAEGIVKVGWAFSGMVSNRKIISPNEKEMYNNV